jgi:hypothetical protein
MSLNEEQVETIASKFPTQIALHDGQIYGVRCPKKQKTYQLIRVSQAGGETTIVASWDRKAGKKCRITSLAVNRQYAIVADWHARRLIGVSLADGQTKEVAKGYPFPQNIILDGDSFVFQSSKGITRIPQAGGEAKLITSSGTSPFHKVAANETDLYIIAEDAYANSGSLERVPLAGGKPKTLTAWRIRGDLGSGIDRIAADDQCVYYAKTHTDFTSIIARIK